MKFSGSNIYVPEKRRVPPIVFMLVFFGGVMLSTVLISITDNINGFYRLLFTHNLYKTKVDISFIDLFLRNALPVAFLLVVQFFSGYFAFGQVFAYLTAVYRGMVTGISASFTYMVLGGKGFFAVLVSVIPFALATAVIVILGARETVRQSRQVAEFSFFCNSDGTSPDMKLYLTKFVVLAAATVISSFADGLVTYFLWNRIFYC